MVLETDPVDAVRFNFDFATRFLAFKDFALILTTESELIFAFSAVTLADSKEPPDDLAITVVERSPAETLSDFTPDKTLTFETLPPSFDDTIKLLLFIPASKLEFIKAP